MKTILVPTDFKEPAGNALAYAASLARIIPSRIILCHIYHVPIPVSGDVPVLFTAQTDVEKPLQEALQAQAFEFSNGYGKGIPVECMLSPGFAVDEITSLADEEHVDFIVMGSGKEGHAFFGSIITGIIENCEKPLIIVPETTAFQSPRKIALACDYKEGVKPQCMKEVKDLVAQLNAELFVINVENPEKQLSDEDLMSTRKVDEVLAGVEHTFHFPVHKDVVAGIVEFDDSHQIDLLIMIPKKHSFLKQLFHTSKTKQMALHTHIPILVMHGKAGVCE